MNLKTLYFSRQNIKVRYLSFLLFSSSHCLGYLIFHYVSLILHKEDTLAHIFLPGRRKKKKFLLSLSLSLTYFTICLTFQILTLWMREAQQQELDMSKNLPFFLTIILLLKIYRRRKNLTVCQLDRDCWNIFFI